MRTPRRTGPIPPEIEGIDPLSSGVFRAFMRNLHLHRHLMARLLADKEAPSGQALCLRVLVDHDGISQRDLADILHLARPTVTTMLQRMERGGLIERRADEVDQRVTRVHVTPQGHELERALRAVFAEYVTTTIDPMSEKDRRELTRLLGILGDNTRAALGDSPHTMHGHDTRSDR